MRANLTPMDVYIAKGTIERETEFYSCEEGPFEI